MPPGGMQARQRLRHKSIIMASQTMNSPGGGNAGIQPGQHHTIFRVLNDANGKMPPA